MNKYRILVSLMLLGSLVSCGGDDSTSPDPTTGIEADFSALSSDVMPVVDSAVEGLLNNRLRTQSTITSCEADWTCNNVEQGNIAYQLYRLLADADDDPALLDYADVDQFQVSAWGVENLQNELDLLAIMAGNLTGSDSGTVTETEQGETYTADVGTRGEYSPVQAISPLPYENFGSLTSETYQYHRMVDLASNGGQDGNLHLAWKVDGDVTNLLVGNTWMNESGGVHERGIYLGRFDETTGDLTLNVAMWTEQGFLPQWEIIGNATDHSFQAKYRKANVGVDGGYNMSLVGLGVSQGSGEYFLFKVKEWEGDVTESEAPIVYYCVNASATREHFGQAYNNGGTFTDLRIEGVDILKHWDTAVESANPTEGWCGDNTYETQLVGIEFLSAGGTSEADFDSEFLN